MPSIRPRLPHIAAVLALTVAGGAALALPATAGPGNDAARCELRVARQGGALALTALAHAKEEVSGRYRLRVSGPGTNIQQSGDFVAAPGHAATLGSVTLNAGAQGLDARLDVVVNGETLSCARRVAGGI